MPWNLISSSLQSDLPILWTVSPPVLFSLGYNLPILEPDLLILRTWSTKPGNLSALSREPVLILENLFSSSWEPDIQPGNLPIPPSWESDVLSLEPDLLILWTGSPTLINVAFKDNEIFSLGSENLIYYSWEPNLLFLRNWSHIPENMIFSSWALDLLILRTWSFQPGSLISSFWESDLLSLGTW